MKYFKLFFAFIIIFLFIKTINGQNLMSFEAKGEIVNDTLNINQLAWADDILIERNAIDPDIIYYNNKYYIVVVKDSYLKFYEYDPSTSYLIYKRSIVPPSGKSYEQVKVDNLSTKLMFLVLMKDGSTKFICFGYINLSTFLASSIRYWPFDGGDENNPDIAVDSDGRIYITWSRKNILGGKEILFKRISNLLNDSPNVDFYWSLDGGVLDLNEYEMPSVAIYKNTNSNKVAVVYQNTSDGEIYVKKSSDNGANWSNRIKITNTPNYVEWRPRISTYYYDDNWLVVFNRASISSVDCYGVISTDFFTNIGISMFFKYQRIFPNARNAEIDEDGSNYFAGAVASNNEILTFRLRIDYLQPDVTITLQNVKTINDNYANPDENFRLSCCQNHAVSWVDNRNGTKDVYFDSYYSTPVELAFFSAATRSNIVELQWKTATESNNYGFDIEKGSNNTTFKKIGFIEGRGTTNIPQNYSFVDNYVNPDNYFYRLKQVDMDGSFEYSNIIEVVVMTPAFFTLLLPLTLFERYFSTLFDQIFRDKSHWIRIFSRVWVSTTLLFC